MIVQPNAKTLDHILEIMNKQLQSRFISLLIDK